MATVISRRSKDEHLAKWRRLQIVKVALAFLFVLLLLSAGFQGRQRARIQARLDDMLLVSDQLQQTLDDEQRPSGPLAGGDTNASRTQLSNPKVRTLISALQGRLGQFNADYKPGKVSQAERLQVRLIEATLANAEQRFADALTIITNQDELGQRAGTDRAGGLLVRVLQLRGDAFYGLRQWPDALARYQQVLTLKPNRLGTTARAADCHYALGRTNEALAAYEEWAKIHDDRGNAALVQRKADAALDHYAKAIEVQTRLVEQGRNELAGELALSHRNLANALLVRGKPGAAIGHYQRAIEIQTQLITQQGRSELANDLAISHSHLGHALLSQQKLDAIIAHYDQAIEIQARLHEQSGGGELANDLALTHNNRGAVRRAQGKLDAALADFDTAINSLTALIEEQRRSVSVTTQTNRGTVRRAPVKLDVVIGYSEKDVELQTRPRLAGQAGPRETAIALAMVLKNRGHAYLAQSKLDRAIGDFRKSAEIYAGLVGQDGQTDLALPFAMSLTALAWIQATAPDASLRDGRTATACARKAGELTEWKAFGPLQALAAACAETGNFAEAVKWQEKAIELAPRGDKAEMRSRLELYKSARPYRTVALKAG